MPVATNIALVVEGQPAQDIVAAYPDLEPDDTREALLFAAEAVCDAHCLLQPVYQVLIRQCGVPGIAALLRAARLGSLRLSSQRRARPAEGLETHSCTSVSSRVPSRFTG
jgi:hypothetical protein